MRLTVKQDEVNIVYLLRRIEFDTLHIECGKKWIFRINDTHLRQREKFTVGVVETFFIIPVILHMLRLNVGNNGKCRVGIQKALIALIRFENHFIVGVVSHVGTKLLADGTNERIGFRQE